MTDGISILTFATEDQYGPGLHGIQWQFPRITINCTALDFKFALKIVSFIKETRNNPKYRDKRLGKGRWRYMDEKSLDLTPYFKDLTFILNKCGKCDHGYYLSFESISNFRISFHIADKELDDFLYGLNEDIIDMLMY